MKSKNCGVEIGVMFRPTAVKFLGRVTPEILNRNLYSHIIWKILLQTPSCKPHNVSPNTFDFWPIFEFYFLKSVGIDIHPRSEVP